MIEHFTRGDAVVAEVNKLQRLVTMLAVPWNQEAKVEWRGELWNEVFRKGAFDGLDESAGRIRVNREHKKGETVGRLVFADPQAEDGLITRAKIVESDRGDETLALAAEDMISPSVGFYTEGFDDLRLVRRTKLREVIRAKLDHLSMVESPAYAGATVIDVRDDETDITGPPPFAATLDEAWSNPVYLRALERLSTARQG